MRPRETRLSSFAPSDPVEVVARPGSEEPPALSVGAVVAAVNAVLDQDRFRDVWIRGEVSSFKPASSGHWYFELKDDAGLLKGAMFRADNARVKFQPENGMEVVVRGRVQIYPTRSELQVVAREMRPVGVGPLQLAFEQLRRRLEAEGLFHESRKRPIPAHPRVVGVATSLQGAVLRDIVRTVQRRHPALHVVVAGCRVQGDGAAAEVASAIAALNAHGACDVILVARGGGSMEDLWCFNEEVVVRAVVASRVPVISGVGHETDYTLCDFAADRRASTPTAAAEMVSLDAARVLRDLDAKERRLARALESLVPALRQDVDAAMTRAEAAVKRTLDTERDLLAASVARLHALSPLAVLARGYAIVRREDGRVVRALADAPPGESVEVVLKDGSADATITRHKKGAP